jgi:hypothetical protein
MLEVNDVHMVVVIYIVGGDPLLQLMVKTKSKVTTVIPRSRLIAKVKSKILIMLKSVAKPLVEKLS